MKTNKTMERILVKNPYTNLEIDVLPILKFMNQTFFGGMAESTGMSTGMIAAREIQNCTDFFVGVTVLANKEGWDETDNCMNATFKLIELRKAFEAMKEVR